MLGLLVWFSTVNVGDAVLVGVFTLFPKLGALWWVGRVFDTHQRRHRLRVTPTALVYDNGRGSSLTQQWSVAHSRITAVQVAWFSEALDVSISTASDGLPTWQATFGAPLYRVRLGFRPLSHYVLLERWLQLQMAARWGREVL